MDFLGFLAIGLITFFSTLGAIIFSLIYIKNTVDFNEYMVGFLELVSTDEELQKLLYQVGGVLGNGVKGGLGIDLPRQRSGRFKLQDLLIDLAGQYMSRGVSLSPSPSPNTPNPNPRKDIKTQELSDKW